MMNRRWSVGLCVLLILAGFALRQLRMFDYPFYGDELKNGDIALEILSGNIAPFFSQGYGREALYGYSMAAAFALFGDSVLANRWPSVIWSVLLIPLMYAYGVRLFASRRIGVLCAGLSAGLWWAAVFAHSGLRVVSMPVIMIPALISLYEICENHAPRVMVWGGLFAGLTAYTYISGRGFPIVAIAFILYIALFHRAKIKGKSVAVYLGLMLLSSLWLYLYLMQNPALDSRLAIAGYGMTLVRNGEWAALGENIGRTLGMFVGYGDPVWLYNISGRPVFPGLIGLVFLIGVVHSVALWRKPAYALQLILFAVMLMPSILTSNAPDSATTRAIGVLPAAIVMTALPIEWGWRKIEAAQTKRTTQIALAYAIGVVVLISSVYVRTSWDMLGRWIDHPGVYGMTVAQYGESAEFVNQSKTTQLNFNMPVYQAWRATNIDRPIRRDGVASFRVRNQALVFRDPAQSLSVAFEKSESPHAILQESFFASSKPSYTGKRVDTAGEHPLQVFTVDPVAMRLANVRVDSVVLNSESGEVLRDSAEFGQSLRFVGYEILSDTEGVLPVLTWWQVLQPPPDLAIFLHVLDPESGELVTQHDGFDAIFSELEQGDIIAQLHTIPIEGVLAGEYQLQLGTYRRDNLQRMPINVESQKEVLWLDTWQKVD